MNAIELKNTFNQIAKSYGFISVHSVWYLNHTICNVVIALQKSGYGDFYYLRIKVYIHGAFGKLFLLPAVKAEILRIQAEKQ